MSVLTMISWLILAAIHAAPAAVLFAPSLVGRLYGIASDGDVGLLIVHRGALFLAVLAVALWAAFEPRVRPAALLVTGISMIGFLLVYARAGYPDGALRTIALVDLIGLVPFAWAIWDVWRSAC